MRTSRLEGVLAEWRAAERRLESAEIGSREWQAAQADVARLLLKYQSRLTDEDDAHD